MNITFVGTGYVGLVSGVMLGYLGHRVVCSDNNSDKIRGLQEGRMPIYEPMLDKYVKISSERVSFGVNRYEASDLVFIAVGTPPLESGDADLSYIYDAVMQVAQNYNSDTLIVIKSTVPPGTCLKLEAKLRENGFGHEVASNPEFLREGSAIKDFLSPDRIVIGVRSNRAEELLREVYKPLSEKGVEILVTNQTTSELIKYASNSFLATKIGFINEMANLCEKVDADVDALSKGMGMDHRIGGAFLQAGPGFGGSCFPKDLLALSHMARRHGQPCHILDAVIFSNKHRPAHMVSKISDAMGGLNGKRICVLGITFKAGTDDVRSSPAVDIINLIIAAGAVVVVYDPEGVSNGSIVAPKAEFADSIYAAATGSDALVILTEWDEFKDVEFKELRDILNSPYIFDFRNILDRRKIESLGFSYYKVG